MCVRAEAAPPVPGCDGWPAGRIHRQERCAIYRHSPQKTEDK